LKTGLNPKANKILKNNMAAKVTISGPKTVVSEATLTEGAWPPCCVAPSSSCERDRGAISSSGRDLESVSSITGSTFLERRAWCSVAVSKGLSLDMDLASELLSKLELVSTLAPPVTF
jgi:hypothetical protein